MERGELQNSTELRNNYVKLWVKIKEWLSNDYQNLENFN